MLEKQKSPNVSRQIYDYNFVSDFAAKATLTKFILIKIYSL